MKSGLPRRDQIENIARLRGRRDVSSRVDEQDPPSARVGRGSPSNSRKRRRTLVDAATGHVILFLAANPRESNLLELSEECAEIQRELKMTRDRDRFRFESRWAVNIDDLMRHLTDLDPTVVHFSGHGCGSAGLMLQDEHGRPQLVSARALAMMLEATTSRLRLVVLSACYSDVQARELSSRIECVVSMNGAIEDEAARAFAIRFYGALGNGRSVGNAMEHGIAALAAKQLRDELVPRCRTRDGIDAHDSVL
jgi:hypothetical protein